MTMQKQVKQGACGHSAIPGLNILARGLLLLGFLALLGCASFVVTLRFSLWFCPGLRLHALGDISEEVFLPLLDGIIWKIPEFASAGTIHNAQTICNCHATIDGLKCAL